MRASGSNPLAVITMVATALLPAVNACLTLTGTTSAGLGSPIGSITANDNGVQTCKGDMKAGNHNVACIGGYSLNYDFSDAPITGPFPITYCNPTNCYGLQIPVQCTRSNCCGGNIPCSCWSCNFGFQTFC